MTIRVLIDETHSTPEEREAFYQQPTIGKALDELAYHAIPNVELRVLTPQPNPIDFRSPTVDGRS